MSGPPIDASVLVRPGTPEWPGDTPYACGWTWRLAEGASVNLSALTMSPHVGTHADAPLHVRDGASGADALPLDVFAGAAYVLTLDGDPRDVSLAELAPRIPAGVERLLLRTGHHIAGGRFPHDWPALTGSAAAALASGGLRLLGVDAPSVDRRESRTLAVHHAIFDGGGCVLENLDLRAAPDGWYELAAYPLKLEGLDAAPVRAVLHRITTYPDRT
ncbi:MAG TPA: cyclase family protein [Gemmatimonadaceae bacterium]|nr:cyclase family protein [Gemmatimonadaceae bacterium]